MNENKKNSLLPIMLLSLAHLVTDLGQGALPVLLPFLKEAFTLTYAQVGFIVLIQNLTSSVIQPLFGYWTDKSNHDWLLVVGVLFAGVGIAITGLVKSYFMLLSIVIVTGIGVASFHPQASKAANLLSDPASKGRSMGIFSVGGNLGMATGSFLMALLVVLPGGMLNSAYLIIPNLIVVGLLMYYKDLLKVKAISAQRKQIADKIKPKRANWYMFLLLVFIFMRSTVQMSISTYLPLYYINFLGGDLKYAAKLITVFLTMGAVGTMVGAVLSDRLGRKNVLLISMGLCVPILILIPYSHGIYTMILAGLGGFSLVLSSATTVILAQDIFPNNVGMASGLTIGFSIGLGGMGVTLMGAIADNYGLPVVFQGLIFLPILAALFVFGLPKYLGQNEV